jgi:hypothetical protein
MDWSSINSSWDQVGKNIRAAIGTWFQGGIDKIVGGAFFVYTAIKDWFTDKLDKLTIGAIFVYTAIKDWFTDKLDKLTIGATFVYTAIKDWFWNGLNSIETSWNDLWSWISDWIKSGINSITSGIGLGNILPFANGGQINEPIMGIGRSGQMYSFGENGSETVIPNGESGGSGITLNISVGNISSEGDMRNFETRVMDILENANSRRGRL